jgi:hypothetical protein
VLFLYLSAAGALVITATIAMGDAGGFTTLLRAHRYWPLLFLGIAICAGAGASYFLDVVREAGRRKVRAAMAIIVCLAIPSPITASIALPTISSGDMYDSLTGDPDTLLNVIASWHAKGMCTVAAPDNLEQAGSIAGYTGYRLVSFPNGTETGNPAIRWADLHAQRPSDTERALVNRQITEGRATPHTWRTLVRAFGVDFVVIPLRRLGASAFHTLDDIRPIPSEDVAVARVGKCSE